jgi:threonine synthase
VLDEFFRTGVYRPRGSAETQVTSSPSMDISKASNFERFIFDLVGRDASMVRELWRAIDAGGAFDLRTTSFMPRLPDFGIVSGRSTHADRLATIRDVWQRHQQMIDPHTADGVKVAREHLLANVPMIVLETAQAVKFADTIREALGREPIRPQALAGIETLPQHVTVMDADIGMVKAFVASHC